MNLWIANFQSGVTAEAIEFRYLFDWLVSEARLIFSHVTVAHACLHQTDHLPVDADYVLLVGPGPVYLSSRSLNRMRMELDMGHAGAVPCALTAYPSAAKNPLYTLSDFQRIEMQLLAQQQDGEDGSESLSELGSEQPWAVSLWKRSAMIDYWSELSHPEHDKVIADKFLSDKRVSNVGIYHAFINYYGQLRKDILPYVPRAAENILEIGCGEGYTGEYL